MWCSTVTTVVFENLHRVAPILFEVIGVWRPAHDGFPLLAEFLGERTRPDVGADPDVVENDDVGPLDLRAPVVGLGDEAVADLRVALGLDEVLHVVALAVDPATRDR